MFLQFYEKKKMKNVNDNKGDSYNNKRVKGKIYYI